LSSTGRRLLASALFLASASAWGQLRQEPSWLKLLVLGDVNLGRAVGQELLKGNTRYPFTFVDDSLRNADVVFVNLESPLTDQKGETQHPKYNLIFCGPPEGAQSLKDANVLVVSTANNHAFDYGFKGLTETIGNLELAGVQFVGTSVESVGTSTPAIVERKGIRIGFLAYTQFVNLKGPWSGHIALFEHERARQEIQSLRPQVDLILVSYHAGAEYVDKPSGRLRKDFEFLVDCGADIVVGHHAHYPQGVELYRGKLIFFSLGNFVFYQPQLEWTQFGLGAELNFRRDSTKVRMQRVGLKVARAGLQPTFAVSTAEEETFFKRLKALSSVPIVNSGGNWVLDMKEYNGLED
jgi:poly-gamma-glutamate capsule biosynthesis protein CapA/YwtB (metallophosphatase superfamily)